MRGQAREKPLWPIVSNTEEGNGGGSNLVSMAMLSPAIPLLPFTIPPTTEVPIAEEAEVHEGTCPLTGSVSSDGAASRPGGQVLLWWHWTGTHPLQLLSEGPRPQPSWLESTGHFIPCPPIRLYTPGQRHSPAARTGRQADGETSPTMERRWPETAGEGSRVGLAGYSRKGAANQKGLRLA